MDEPELGDEHALELPNTPAGDFSGVLLRRAVLSGREFGGGSDIASYAHSDLLQRGRGISTESRAPMIPVDLACRRARIGAIRPHPVKREIERAPHRRF
jgi:hypothetical protein